MSVWNRMVVAALALTGAFVSTYLLLFKLGVLGTLVCGAGGGCDIVQSSRYAYLLGMPVAGWGLGGYLAIFGVAMAGTRPELADRRWIPGTILGLTGGAFLFSVYLSAVSGLVIQAWCQWCLVSASLATLAFLFSMPEARRLGRKPQADEAQETRAVGSPA
jgi:uncharacterized membrane protein